VSASGRALLRGAAVLVAATALVCATAVLATGIRLRAAGLPFGHGVFVVPVGHSLLVAAPPSTSDAPTRTGAMPTSASAVSPTSRA
jgi:hypothetical protein